MNSPRFFKWSLPAIAILLVALLPIAMRLRDASELASFVESVGGVVVYEIDPDDPFDFRTEKRFLDSLLHEPVAVDVSGTAFSDADLRELARFQCIQVLDLSSTQITQEAVEVLPRFEKLQILVVRDTVFARGEGDLTKFSQERPKVRVVSSDNLPTFDSIGLELDIE